MTLLFIAVLVTVFAFIYWVFVVKPEDEMESRPLEEILPPYKEADSPKKTSLELCEEYRVRQQELTQKAVEDHNKNLQNKNTTWIG